MIPEQIIHYGDALYQALRSRTTLPPILAQAPEVTIDDAYRIQTRFVERRLADGDQIVGKKIGVTSRPVQEVLGVFQPDFGQLTKEMLFRSGDTIDLDTLIQPKAEAELAFVLKSDLRGPGITAMDVLRATDYVMPCFEIVDSRIDDWKIAIQDTIADNASCGVFVLGDTRRNPRELDLVLAGMVVEKNRELVTTGVGAAVQGSPLNAVAWLANTLGERGVPFRAGEIILSGSQGDLVAVADGDTLTCEMAGLGACHVHFSQGNKR